MITQKRFGNFYEVEIRESSKGADKTRLVATVSVERSETQFARPIGGISKLDDDTPVVSFQLSYADGKHIFNSPMAGVQVTEFVDFLRNVATALEDVSSIQLADANGAVLKMPSTERFRSAHPSR